MSLPVVDHWFRMRDVAPGLIQIDEPYAHEFVRGNIWWRQGHDRDLIVDTGLGVGSLKQALEAESHAQGRLWREPIVVLTHGHLDHAGGAAEFDDVRAHPGDTPAAVTSLHAPTFARQLGAPSDPSMPSDMFVTASPRTGWDPAVHDVGEITVTAVEDGDVIDLGDRQYEVLHLPGHTPGSLALVDRANRELISGDAVYDDYLLDGLHESNQDDYRVSMKLLAALEVDVVRPGHGASFDRYVLDRIARAYLAGGP